MREPLVFPYRIYRNYPCPIIKLTLYRGHEGIETEAYVDSGATISLFSPLDAQRMRLDYTRGKKIFSIVGDGSLIPVYLHKLRVKIGYVMLNATIGFSPRLGVGFNLLGRRDFFTAFDITFSDSRRAISFLPRK